MPNKLKFLRLEKFQVFEVNVSELIDLIRSCGDGTVELAYQRLVLIHALFNGGWYTYKTDDFTKRCEKFVKFPTEFHDEKLVKEIFEIFEAKTLKTDPVPEGMVPDVATVVFDAKGLAGVWTNLTPSRLINFSNEALSDEEKLEIVAELAEAAPLSEAPPKEVPLCRNPHLISDKESCPAVGDEINVTVFCNTSPSTLGEVAEELEVSGAAAQDEFKITVFLSPGEGLSVKGDATKILKVYRSKKESEPVSFKVIVDKEPKGEEVELNAYFFYRGRPCGRVTRILSVIPGIEPAQRPGKLAKSDFVTVSELAGHLGGLTGAQALHSGPHCARFKLSVVSWK